MIVTVTGVLVVCARAYAGATSNTSFVDSATGDVIGNLATDGLKYICRFGDAKFLGRYREIDHNLAVARTIRSAQLDALESVLQRFNDARRMHRDETQQLFAEHLARFIRREQAAAKKLQFDGKYDATAREISLRQDVVATFPQRATAAALRKAYRNACETVVLREIEDSACPDIPPLFRSAFAGAAGRADGWFDMFFRAVARHLATDDVFDAIWQKEQIAAIGYVLERADLKLDTLVAATRDAFVNYGRALDALSGDVAALRAIYSRDRDEGLLPLRREVEVDITGVRRFKPRNPHIPFLGRGAEMAALLDFLDSPPDFAWWLVSGAGGAGKTRLALQLVMKATAEGWNAGFLPTYLETLPPGDIRKWAPERPTLIVIDYALRRKSVAWALADGLVQRYGKLPQPVRLLLLEREGGRNFDLQFRDSARDDPVTPRRHDDRVHGYGTELAVPPLTEDELWALVEGRRWHDGTERAFPAARPAFFARLREIDNAARPLVAMILADAIAADSHRAAFTSLEGELKDLLARERREIWSPALGCAGVAIGERDVDVVIALAAMIDGVGSADFATLVRARGKPLSFDEVACTRVLGSMRGDGRYPPLEPDLIGEYFALEVLASASPFRGLRHPWLGETAWRTRPERMADFVRRAVQNFPAHPSLAPLQEPIEGILETWRLRAFSLLDEAPDLDAGLIAVMDAMRDAARSDPAAAVALANAAVAVTALPDEASAPSLRFELLQEIAAAMRAFDER